MVLKLLYFKYCGIPEDRNLGRTFFEKGVSSPFVYCLLKYGFLFFTILYGEKIFSACM